MTHEVVLLATPSGVRRCVRFLRRQHGWNQAQLAEAVGRSQQWVSNFENGRSEASLGDAMEALSALEARIAVQASGAHSESV